MPPEQPADPPPGPAAPAKVEISVAGHTIVVEGTAVLSEVADLALGLFQQTTPVARSATVGYSITGGTFERSEAYDPPIGFPDDRDHVR